MNLDDKEALALSQALAGKCLIGVRESPFLLAKIQESRNEEYVVCYDFWLYDGGSAWESRRPFLAKTLPALVRWVQMRGLHFKEPVSWEIKEVKEVKNADIDI